MVFLVRGHDEHLCLTFLSPLMGMGSKFQDKEKKLDLELISTAWECLHGGQADIFFWLGLEKTLWKR